MKRKLHINIKGMAKDALGAIRAAKNRTKKIAETPADDIAADAVTNLAQLLHPGVMRAEVQSIENVGVSTKKVTFFSAKPVYFLPGTSLTITLRIGESIATRPYSICSSPSLGKQGIVSILVKEVEDGFVSRYINRDLKVGDEVFLEIGLGNFSVDVIRDAPHIVAIAGGVGIAPFLAMAHHLNEQENPPYDLTILYGSRKENDILCKEELHELEGKAVKVIHVLSDEPSAKGEKGFINRDIIQKYSPDGPVSYFLCGPKRMEEFVFGELKSLGIDLRHVRSDCHTPSPRLKDSPRIYCLTVHQGESVRILEAREDETLLETLERAGIYVHSRCRHGVCGACRMQVLSGEYEVTGDEDGRRAIDKQYGYVHSCRTYPRGDMEIRINIAILP